MSLQEWGWSDFFERQRQEPGLEGLTAFRVTEEHKTAYRVSSPEGEFLGKLAGRFVHETQDAGGFPVIGDWVLARPPAGDWVQITHLLRRSSVLVRRQPSDRSALAPSAKPQVLAANLDLVFIVMSLNQDLSPARLERALTVIWESGATPVVLLSKCDLHPEPGAAAEQMAAHAQGAAVHWFSSRTGEGVDSIRRHLTLGRTACLIGSSGVGKSTLTNLLCGTQLKTLEVREDDDRGRHTTTSRRLFRLPDGGMLIDTPGLREIGLFANESGLAMAFGDIAALATGCRFRDCSHESEPGCAVRAAVDSGRLDPERLDHFRKLRKESAYLASKDDPSARQALKQRDKQIGKWIKEFYQPKGRG